MEAFSASIPTGRTFTNFSRPTARMVNRFVDPTAAPRDLQQRYTFLHRSASNGEEVLAVWLREATVAFSQIGGDRECGPIQLIGEKAESTREVLRQGDDLIGESDGLLVDLELLEHEGRRNNSAK